MTIQEATKACLTEKNLFGRPISWKGTGSAIDLACRLDKSKPRKVMSLQSPNRLLGSEWSVSPQDLLNDWEVVTTKELALEVCQIEKPGV